MGTLVMYLYLVPEERLELSHLAATASKTVVSTIPPSGQNFSLIWWAG